MSYRAVPRKAVRYTEATRPDQQQKLQTTQTPVESVSYRDLQARAKVLGISGKQPREALIAAIEEAENA